MISNFRGYVLIILSGFILSSCSKDEETIVQDDYQYLALRNDGKLFAIGDQTGVVEDAGSISGLEFNTVFNSVTSSSENTYVFEFRFSPLEQRLFIRNRETGKSEMVLLEFPEEFGNGAGFMSLDWDESQNNLVGIVKQEYNLQNSMRKPVKVVRLDPETFEFEVIEDLDLFSLGYQLVYSSQLIGQKLYVSASKTTNRVDIDFLEIDFSSKTIEVLSQESINTGFFNLGRIPGTNILLGFAHELNTGYTGAAKPYLYDLDNQQLDLLEAVPRISVVYVGHKTFVNPHTGEMVGLIARDGFALFKYDHKQNDFKIIPMTKDLSTFISIIDVIEL